MTSFGLNAFNACLALESVRFAANVITIGEKSFRNCTNLERVVLGPNTQSIIFAAFFRDAKLRSIVIPKNCSTIGAQAFDSCTNLTIYCEVESKPDGWDANWNKSKCPIVWGYKDQDYPELVTKVQKIDELNNKFDKSGGTINGDVEISGNLTVSGTTTTQDTETLQVKDNVIVANSDGVELIEEGGFAIKTDDTSAYGIMYDPVGDGVKIGLGAFDENGKFEYTEGEDQFIATRANTIEDGHIPKWDNEAKQFIDSGIGHDEYAKLTDYAGDGKVGVVQTSAYRGVQTVSNGLLILRQPKDEYIDNRNNGSDQATTFAVTLSKFDHTLRKALTDGQLTLTDEEKASACETIGAASKKYVDSKASGTQLYKVILEWGEDDWDSNTLIYYTKTLSGSLMASDDLMDCISILVDIDGEYVPIIRTSSLIKDEEDYYGAYLVCDFYYFEGSTQSHITYNELYGETNEEGEEYYPGSWKQTTVKKL